MNDTRRELIERYRAARHTLAEAVDAHPGARVGEWTGEKILLHVAAWDRERTGLVPRLLGGEAEPDYDDDTFNAAAVERLGRLTPEDQRAEYEAAGEAFEAMLRGLPDSAFDFGAPGAYWADTLAEHALEHAARFGDIGA